MPIAVKNIYPIKVIRKIKYDLDFKNIRGMNLFRGVFETFEEAEKALPDDFNQGYDNKESASMYKNYCNTINPSDYPNLLWLSKILKDGSSVFDLGGHIGVKYYSYQKYINFPENFSWTVYDVPAVVKEGKKWAKENHTTNLSFSNDVMGFDGVETLLLSGSLQYMDFDIAKKLKPVTSKPENIIISIPLTHLDTFYSINNIGTSYCVYVLRNEKKFIKDIEDAGYELIDKWRNEGKKCTIPFFPEHSIDSYTGLYFRIK
jgi:putative methyltransferase (TIGR04325 family)